MVKFALHFYFCIGIITIQNKIFLINPLNSLQLFVFLTFQLKTFVQQNYKKRVFDITIKTMMNFVSHF